MLSTVWAQRGTACTLRCKFGPRPGSVVRALRVQSRASWIFLTGLLFATPSRPGPWKPDKVQLFALLLHHTLPRALKFSALRQPRCNSSRTSSSSARNGHGRDLRVCVCAMIRFVLGNRNEQILLKKSGATIAGAGRYFEVYNCTSAALQKQSRSQGTLFSGSSCTTTVQQHQQQMETSSGTTTPALQALLSVTL